MSGIGSRLDPGADPRPHIPVLLAEVVAALAPLAGTVIIDGTFGAGGYTRALLAGSNCRILALDRDPDAVAAGAALVQQCAPRLILVHAEFSTLDVVAAAHGMTGVDGVVLDIGVSSMQLDQPERGFSFMHDGPLDMRMSREGPSAADIVNGTEETALANLIFTWGEEAQSRRIAKAIVRARDEAPITTTKGLVAIIERVLGPPRGDKKHPATRTFQALRIAVNDEMGELMLGLAAAERILKPGGRLAVVSFHSEEDRIVKRFLNDRSGKPPAVSRHAPMVQPDVIAASFRIVNRRPLTPSSVEIAANPRARSAKLRVAVRTAAPAIALAGPNANAG